MNTLNFNEANELINNMRDLGCYKTETFNINEKYNIIIIRNALITILKCIDGTIDELDNLVYYGMFGENDLSRKMQNMIGDIIEKDYRDTNIKSEKNQGLLRVNGSVGFINGNTHINLDSGAEYNFTINSELLMAEDMYFIACMSE